MTDAPPRNSETLERVISSALLAGLVALAILGARQLGVFVQLELLAYDAWHRLERPAARDERLLLVRVTEEDIRARGWPLEDGVLAELIERLAGFEAAAIGVDIYRDMPVGEGAPDLERVLRETPGLVAVWHEGEGGTRAIPPPSSLIRSPRIGFNDVALDRDETVRRALLFMDDGERIYTSFALRLAEIYLAPRGIAPSADPVEPAHMRLGAATLPPLERDDGGYVGIDAAGYQILLDFAGTREVFDSVTLGEVLDPDFRAGRVRERIVLVGLAAESTNDYFALPFLPGGESQLANAGVSVHAHVVSQLVRTALGETRPLRTPGEPVEVAAIGIAALAAALIVAWAPSVTRFLALAALGGLALPLAGWLAFRAGSWWSVAAPSLAWIGSAAVVTAYGAGRERRARAELQKLLANQVSKEVADEIWRNRRALLQGGRPRSRRLEATVLFLDMKGYSARAEKMEATALMEWMDAFLGRMGRVVVSRHGYVDDYFGDGLKAAFGVFEPTSERDDPAAHAAVIARGARTAVEAAFDMERALLDLNAEWRIAGLPSVAMRVGIQTGPMVAGLLGASEKLKYTVVGDVVVEAQRLEGLEIPHDFEIEPCRVLIGSRTAALLDERFPLEHLGDFQVKGLEHPVGVNRVRREASS